MSKYGFADVLANGQVVLDPSRVAAIGMAAGAGLPLLACVVTALHFVIVLGYTALMRRLPGAHTETEFAVTYLDGRGVLRDLLAACTRRSWSITSIAVESDAGGAAADRKVTVALRLSGSGVNDSAVAALSDISGVLRVDRRTDEGD